VLLDGFTKRYPKQRAGIGAWVLGALGGWPGRDLGTAALRRAALEWVRSPGAGSSR
jgi:hypothetical protein